MYSCDQLLQALKDSGCDQALSAVYAPGGAGLDQARGRAVHVTETFQKAFPGAGATALFSGPGRTELGGNHTDHQRGHVLCASVDMDMLACAAPNGLNVIRVHSEGYPDLTVNLEDLAPRKEDENTSAALVRGVAEAIAKRGFALGGFDACAVSSVLSGSGLSSSAAYEILIGNILNHFFCYGKLDAIELAKIGQYAENVHFGKLSGLMDQMGSSVGGAVAIDFGNPQDPAVQPINYDFARSGHALCIVDTGSDHSAKHLTEDYSDITREMRAVAAHFGKQLLREVPEADFRADLPALRRECGDRAVLRAIHYYEDDRRAVQEAEALKAGDFPRFLSLVNASGLSSALHLQNTWSTADPRQQAISMVLAVGRELLGGAGAIRVHGGGVAGTVQAFVPQDKLEDFRAGMEALLGPGMCHVLRIRPQGGCVVVS